MEIAQDGNKKKALSSYGLLNTKYAACREEHVELVQIVEILRRKLEDTRDKKEELLEIAQDGNEKKALSSHSVLNTKYAACREENVELVQLIEKLRRELEATKDNKEDFLAGVAEGSTSLCVKEPMCKPIALGNNRYGKYYYGKIATPKSMEEDNKILLNVRKQLDDFKEKNEQLREGKAACFRYMQELRGKKSKLSDAYELLVEENGLVKQRLEHYKVGLAGQREWSVTPEKRFVELLGRICRK
jgi:hypothetical protein